MFYIDKGTTGVEDGLLIPKAIYLSPPRPTPFQASTAVAYGLPKLARVRIQIFDVGGRLVRTVLDGIQAPGHKSVSWAGDTDRGDPAGSGVPVTVMQYTALSEANVIEMTSWGKQVATILCQ